MGRDPTSDELTREALGWLSRISLGEATQDDLAELRQWRDRSTAHAAALAEAGRLWRGLELPVAALAREQTAVRRRGFQVSRRAFVGGGMAAAAAAAGAMMVRPPLGLWPSITELAADHRTGTGEQLHVAVGEAVSVDLNTRTSIALRGASQDGAMELLAGEAAVVVDGRASQPFVVTAADGHITASRASFNVRRTGPRVDLTCIDGEVAVACNGRHVIAHTAERVTYDDRGMSEAIATDPATVTAWRDGMLVFRNAPLADVIDEVNRYRPGRIVLLDGKLGQRVVTARFEIKRLDTVMGQIAAVFKAPVRTLPGGLVLVG
ncbi:FecR family protein [Bradyrhizobium sp. 2TAF24]|uniref:FecR family protein n=1 Tax=Bradyrhizobium sp. 2TAF24 TaxID=3233011 RepID=UPI003F930E39